MKTLKLICLLFVAFQFFGINLTDANAQSVTIKMKRPPLNTLGIADLYNIELTNNSRDRVEFYLYGTLSEAKAGLLATATTVSIVLGPNEKKQFKASDLPKTPDISYPNADNRYKEALMRKGSLPDGNYTICVTVKQTGTNEELGNDCIEQEISIQSEVEISLLTPDNKTQIGPDEPVIFSWTVLGGKTEGPYKIKIVEIKQDEPSDNAMLKNKAFFEKEEIRMTTFQYPSSATKFVEGKSYAWQVSTGKTKSVVNVFQKSGTVTPTTASLTPFCTTFEDGTTGGWQPNNILTTVQSTGGNPGRFIETTDQYGASYFFNTDSTYIGDWGDLMQDSCGSLCFDIKFIYEGNEYNGTTPPLTMQPSITIESGSFIASFIPWNTITVGDGWHSYCAPLKYLNSDGTLPSNSDGRWVISSGTASDWNTILGNVTRVRLPCDPSSYQNERIGYDNICIKNTGDCVPSTGSSNPCDSLLVTAQTAPGGDCCWSINLINNQSAIGINGVQFLTEAPITFSGYPATPSNSQWQYQSSSPTNLSLVNVSGNNLSQGQTTNFINFCLNNYVTSPQSVIVNWKHNDSTVCTDTLKLNCQRECLEINIDSVYCFGDGYNINFSFLNQAGFDIHTLELTPVTPGIIITPATITLSPDVVPGSTSGMQTIFVSNADDLSELCFKVKAIGPENCCFCTDSICVPVLSCICSDVDASANYVGPGCQWNVSLNNNYLPNYFTGVSLNILTSGVTYSGTVTAPTGWMLNNPSPFTTVTYKPLPWTNGGKVPSGTTSPLSFSLAGYTSAPTTIVVNWLTASAAGDSIVCRDTLTLNCTPPPSNNGCLGIFNDSLWCNADGTFGYQFQVYNAINGFTAEGFALSPLPVGSATFNPAVFPGLNLPSLTSSSNLNTTISDINPGEQLCFRTTMYDSIYSINNQTWSTLCCHFDTCYTMPNCGNVVNDSCKCGQWLEPWDDISEQIKLTVGSATGSATYYVDCDYNNSTPVGPLPAGNTVMLQASYQCNPYTCAALYDWYLINTATSQTIASGTDVSMPINFTPPANVAATYHFVLIPNCGTSNCDTCGFYFTTNVSTPCNCALGSWNTTNNLISYITGSTPMNVSMSNGTMYTVNHNSSVTITPSYNCPPNCGPVSYFYRMNNDPIVSGPWTITNITSVKDMMIFAKCGDRFCDSMRISIRPAQQQGCNCGVNNPFTGNITISNPTTNTQLPCGTNSGATFASGNYSFYAPSFQCQGTPVCTPVYGATLIRNGVIVADNQLLPSNTFGANLMGPLMLNQTVPYTVKFKVYCNGVLCDSCQVSFRVGTTIINHSGSVVSRIRDRVINPNTGVSPTIFNPVSTLTPTFTFSNANTGIFRLIELNPGTSNKIDFTTLNDAQGIFEVPVNNANKVEFPQEMKSLKSGVKYLWVLYSIDEKTSEANVLESGLFVAGMKDKYEVKIGKCEDCGKCDLCFEYNGECYCITKKK